MNYAQLLAAFHPETWQRMTLSDRTLPLLHAPMLLLNGSLNAEQHKTLTIAYEEAIGWSIKSFINRR